MKQFEMILRKRLSDNGLDNLTDGLVNNLGYSDSSIIYPSFNNLMPNDGLEPEMFQEVYQGNNNYSELNAILRYVSYDSDFNDLAELSLGIALTEMKHYDKLGDFIKSIGGNVRVNFNNDNIVLGDDIIEALQLSILSERQTIDKYTELSENCLKIGTESSYIAVQFLNKLIADEEEHIRLFNERLNSI